MSDGVILDAPHTLQPYPQHLKAQLMRNPPCPANTPGKPTQGVVVLSGENRWRSSSLVKHYWNRSVHLQPDPTLNVNLDNLDLPSVASNRALATMLDFIRKQHGWWTVLEDDAVLLPGCNYSALPTPLPSSCWYISMDERGYTHAPTQALNEYYAESTSDAGLGTAGFFIHARAAQHYLAKWRHNVTKPFDLLIHQSNMEDPAARGRICFMRNAGPRVVHDGRASASKRRQAEAEALEKGKAQRRGHVPEQPKAFVFG